MILKLTGNVCCLANCPEQQQQHRARCLAHCSQSLFVIESWSLSNSQMLYSLQHPVLRKAAEMEYPSRSRHEDVACRPFLHVLADDMDENLGNSQAVKYAAEVYQRCRDSDCLRRRHTRPEPVVVGRNLLAYPSSNASLNDFVGMEAADAAAAGLAVEKVGSDPCASAVR
jgi:hypothetical protein